MDRFEQRVFSSEDNLDREVVLALLNRKLEEEVIKKRERMRPRELKPKKLMKTWKEKVNWKRNFIHRVIQHQSDVNLKRIAKYTKSGFQTVKRIREEMLVHGSHTPFEYNFLKTPEQLASLQATINLVKDTGMGVTEIRRAHPDFSRTKILSELHSLGLKYRPLPKERRTPLHRSPNSTRVRRVISHLAQGLTTEGVEVLYCDEVKFPLYQTATHSWTNLQDSERMVYNRREDERMLTAIALCSIKGFVGVQLFKKEVTGPDFLYFINNIIMSLPRGFSYTILTDNASWHHAGVVQGSSANKFLYFNEPRMFQLNIIENAFSFIRSGFRRRPFVETLEEEAIQIINLFFEDKNQLRFTGLVRNHLRQLIKFLGN